jgi:hypothetical protein
MEGERMKRLTLSLRRAAIAAGFVAIGLPGAAGAATVLVKAGDTTPDAGGCGARTNPCDTIQAGVDNAATGDVVSVAKGDYAEDVVIATPGITLRGTGTLRGSATPACPGDPTRIDFVGGPDTEACRSLSDQTSCEAAWHLSGDDEGGFSRPASCFWDGAECRGCGPNNEENLLCTNSCDPVPPAALLVGADDVTIEKLRVRGPRLGGVTVLPSVQNASLEGVRIEGAGGPCVAGLGSGLTVEKSSLRSCGETCILALGESPRIERNRLLSCGGQGIESRGAGAVVARNSVRLALDCIRFRGNGARLERNQLSLCDGSGIDGFGTGANLLRNQARVTFDGVFLECDSFATTCADATRTEFVGGPGTGPCRDLPDQPACEAAWHIGNAGAATCYWDGFECRGCGPNNEGNGECANTCVAGDLCEGVVSGNRVSDALGDCLDLFAADSGLLAEGNRLAACEDEGIQLAGFGITARRNSVTECGTDGEDHGVLVDDESEDMVVEDSSVRSCAGDGFHVALDALNAMLVGNSAQDNGQDGFDVEAGATGTVIERATARNNIETGIEVGSGATDTSISGSRASGNLADFCDQGTNTTETGNQFGTTSTTCFPDEGEDDDGVI